MIQIICTVIVFAAASSWFLYDRHAKRRGIAAVWSMRAELIADDLQRLESMWRESDRYYDKKQISLAVSELRKWAREDVRAVLDRKLMEAEISKRAEGKR